MKYNKLTALIVIVPLVFIIGIFTFLVGLPDQLRTLTNFIAFMSGLSTTVMVLVYIVTWSNQFEIMGRQLTEMQANRDLQVQPLPYMEEGKAILKLPRYFVGPSTKFTDMNFYTYIDSDFVILNHGNGPAIVVDFIAELRSIPLAKIGEKLDRQGIFPHIDCIPLQPKIHKTEKFSFDDGADGQKILECLLQDHRIGLAFDIVYKNALGKAFKVTIGFLLSVKKEDDLITLKDALKLVKTGNIDFAAEIEEHKRLGIAGRHEERAKILDDVNKKIAESRKTQELDLLVQISPMNFSVKSITEKEYQNWIEAQEKIEEESIKEINGCWKEYVTAVPIEE